MKQTILKYYDDLHNALEASKAISEDGEISLEDGIFKAVSMIRSCESESKKLIFIGNGASAAIASHQATDFWKAGGVKSTAFNDASLLTCISNDYGYEHVFEKPIEMFAEAGDILFAVSSSGSSKNIIKACEAAKTKGVKIITLSGFDESNPLRTYGELNFWVPSKSYGHVEVLHHSICHCILDTLIHEKGIGS